jgi:hypothetical protein
MEQEIRQLVRRNNRNAYALSGQDIPRRLVVSGFCELPFGRGRRFTAPNGVVDAMLGGWQVGGAFTTQSGTPIRIGGGNTNAINGRSSRVDGVTVELPTGGELRLQRARHLRSTSDRTPLAHSFLTPGNR